MAIILYVCAAFSLLFSASCFVPAFGVSFWAFPLSFVSSGLMLFASIRLMKDPSRKNLSVLRKILEYLSFILFAAFIIRRAGVEETTFMLDLASVILWLLIAGTSIVILFWLSDKHIEKSIPSVKPAIAVKKGFGIQILEWVDALLQAACLVLLINLFIFQLYAIPSESMVPEFMIGDRVVVLKTPSGPKFPLTEIGVPRMRTYKRGDIVIFNNPHYNDTKEARVKSFASQLVYMLTFTAVNINRDEFGEIKADPLVKRITGVSGEKLMLVDGVLYSKTAKDTDFIPVQADANWAAWNIDALPLSEKQLVQRVPLSEEAYNLMVSVESIRSNLGVTETAIEARALVERFAALKHVTDTVGVAPELLPKAQREIVSMFQANADTTRMLLTTNGGIAWFTAFMTDWIASSDRENLFDRESMNIDLLLKLDFGRLMVRNAELFAANATDDVFKADAKRQSILADAQNYAFYMGNHDQRNMGEFPEGEGKYIPENNFFMMGDNRFNSLDMRHSYEVRLAPIDRFDPYSFVYRSNLAPQYVPINRILGTAGFTFWPLSRVGKPE